MHRLFLPHIFKNQKDHAGRQAGFASLLMLILLLLGVVVAVYLVSTKTNLFPKADVQSIQFVNDSGQVIQSTQTPIVKVRLAAPNLGGSVSSQTSIVEKIQQLVVAPAKNQSSSPVVSEKASKKITVKGRLFNKVDEKAVWAKGLRVSYCTPDNKGNLKTATVDKDGVFYFVVNRADSFCVRAPQTIAGFQKNPVAMNARDKGYKSYESQVAGRDCGGVDKNDKSCKNGNTKRLDLSQDTMFDFAYLPNQPIKSPKPTFTPSASFTPKPVPVTPTPTATPRPSPSPHVCPTPIICNGQLVVSEPKPSDPNQCSQFVCLPLPSGPVSEPVVVVATSVDLSEDPNFNDFNTYTYSQNPMTVTWKFSNSSPGLKVLYARYNLSDGSSINANPFPAQIELTSPNKAVLAATPSCSQGHDSFKTHMDLQFSGRDLPAIGDQTMYLAVTDEKINSTVIGLVSPKSNVIDTITYHDQVGNLRGGVPSLKLYADGRMYSMKIYYALYTSTEMPKMDNTIVKTTFSLDNCLPSLPAKVLVSPTTVSSKGTIIVNWSGIPTPHANDYMNMRVEDDSNGTPHTYWINNNCTWFNDGKTGSSSGSCNVDLSKETFPKYGGYFFDLRDGVTHQKIGQSNVFTVNDPASSYPKTYTWKGKYVDVTTICPSYQPTFNIQIKGTVPSPASGNGIWTKISDYSSLSSNSVIAFYQDGSDTNINANYQGIVNSIRGETSLQLKTSVSGTNMYTLRIYNAPFTSSKPNLFDPIVDTLDFATDCR